MTSPIRRWTLLACCALVAPLAYATEEIVNVPTRPGVSDAYLLVTTDNAPKKVVALAFIGGNGKMNLVARAARGPLTFPPDMNFLVRIRTRLPSADIAEALVDAPSDRLAAGMSDRFRLGPDHAADIRAVIGNIGKRFPGANVYLVGTSRGTLSAAALGASLHDIVAGTVLTSTVTHPDRIGPGLADFDFATLNVPTLLVHHVADGCYSSPYSGAQALAARFPLVSVKGGNAPLSDQCEPLAPHGFFGVEQPVVAAISAFMLGQPYPREIP